MARNKYPEETVKRILDAATQLFVEKGYDATSLADIIAATHLSKGAIYHHFASKEDIFAAIFQRISQENTEALTRIRDDTSMTGREKLQRIFKAALSGHNQNLMLTVTPNLLENPRFLAMQIHQIYQIVAPAFIEPILRQGMEDGTLHVKDPATMAEAIMILSNVWLNPLLSQPNATTMRRRCETFNSLLESVVINPLLDEEMIVSYVAHCPSSVE